MDAFSLFTLARTTTVLLLLLLSSFRVVESTFTQITCDGSSSVSNPVEISGSGDGTVEFGVGGPSSTYDNLAECYIKITNTDNTGKTNVVFTFFHTEADDSDTVTIYQGSTTSTQIAQISGDPLTPAIYAVDGDTVLLHFQADGTHREFRTSLQLGFHATFVNGDECYNNCAGHGTCSATGGRCTCEGDAESGETMYVADDCSVAVLPMTPDVTQEIDSIAPGEWRYFYYHFASGQSNGWLVDLVDLGDSESDPYLVGGKNRVPRLSWGSMDYFAWIDWYYDRTDIHFVRASSGTAGSTYYFGVGNYKDRAVESVSANITFRLAAQSNQFPCLLDCSGHGSCGTNGMCTCNDDWTGTGWNYPSSCRFEIQDVSQMLDSTMQETNLRSGDWNYYKITIDAEHANARHLLIDMNPSTVFADPILLLRKGSVPRLVNGLIPTYGAFQKDYGDQDGFETAAGSQSISISPEDLDEGDWYIGVYNVWGFTGFSQESHDAADYSLYINLYAAGVPCPRHNAVFCNAQTSSVPDSEQNACNFNTGECECGASYFAEDCSVYAEPLDVSRQSADPPVTRTGLTLAIAETHYFSVQINQSDIHADLNLVFDVSKTVSNEANPIVLCRREGVPYHADSAQFDDHDFLSNYRREGDHRIVMDNEELQPGVYVFSVYNGAENGMSDTLTYSLSVSLSTQVSCPIGIHNAQTCSGHGQCDESLGRCNCDAGFTLDDCSAFGIEALEIAADGTSTVTVSAGERDIPPDGWQFYSFPIGCVKQGAQLRLNVDHDGVSGDAKPLLLMRQGELPLMYDGMYDFNDFYSGKESFGLDQLIIVEPCNANNYCITHPASSFFSYGTIYSTEGLRSSSTYGLDPGVYYVGIYNDVDASDSIVEYTLSFEQSFSYQTTQCASASDCVDGFVGDRCTITCPGVAAETGYTNAPMPSEGSCSGGGTCSLQSNVASCSCDDAHFGDACDVPCPSIYDGAPCTGRGTCTYDGNEDASCQCDAGYAGEGCEDGCPGLCSGRGTCTEVTVMDGNRISTVDVCNCDAGYGGVDCSLECPSQCSSRGTCTTNSSFVNPYCVCDDGWVGDGCELACPDDGDGGMCNGNGTCVAGDDDLAICRCFDGFEGNTCGIVSSAASSGSSSSAPKGLIIGIVVLCASLLVLVGLFFFVRRRFSKKLSYYESIIADMPANDARIQSLIENEGLDPPVSNSVVAPIDIHMSQGDDRAVLEVQSRGIMVEDEDNEVSL